MCLSDAGITMKLIRHLCIITLLVAAVGCVQLTADKRGKQSFIELATYGWERTPATRILLVSSGAARIDIFRHDEHSVRCRTYLFPASPSEVDRLIRVGASIDARAVTEPLHFAELKISPEVRSAFRCSTSSGERRLGFFAAQKSTFYVVDGMVREIGAIGFMDLASAIDDYYEAETLLAADEEHGIRLLHSAVKGYEWWTADRCRRCGEIYEHFVIDTRIGAFDVPVIPEAYERTAKLLKQPSADVKKIAVDVMRETWRDYTKGLRVSRSGDVTIVSFPGHKDENEVSGTPEAISASLAAELMKPEWSPYWP